MNNILEILSSKIRFGEKYRMHANLDYETDEKNQFHYENHLQI